jgi:hypothetical protein
VIGGDLEQLADTLLVLLSNIRFAVRVLLLVVFFSPTKRDGEKRTEAAREANVTIC